MCGYRRGMRESDDEVTDLQALMDSSHATSTSHLRDIISGEHRLSAAQVVGALDGMKVLSLATVTARGEPRISAVDGHFLHARWTFSTDGRAAKARHLLARPAVSAAHLDGERLGVFCHGHARQLTKDDPCWDEALDHWTSHYGSDPTTWSDDIRVYLLEPTWFIAYGAGEVSQA